MANKYPTLNGTVRTEFGKGAARRARVAGQVPVVIYGPDLESPIHITIDRLELTALIRNHGVNAVAGINIDGEEHLTMVKHIDQNVLTLNIDHMDLLAITRGEKVEVEVPVVVEGESAPGTMFIQDMYTIRVEADVLSIPEEITVSVEGMEVDSRIDAGDVELPEGVTLIDEPDLLLVTVVYPEVDEELEAAAEEAEEGGAELGAESEEESEE
ncbi:50S ribosomal protein L25/general stress protein Ctc [Corynebacterium spheniscorum]|uniref:Large ribosomal subunit protein bL25 n=1 Tax=Corynebacterium spheniscorum TaxID=185761 RepID=A0A1I2RZ85_9CORY|nr:50S ribosomal protein L25/general stress protein Ctc [Corynebacterium spheniscorum]KAA8720865.1 50S ribosomal protein L25/general stress protein Ctc [Corynebacterium spheniscorum]SFG45944.1 LSU ribosomal protein L25P [Corynebacterium spheniscorum]